MIEFFFLWVEYTWLAAKITALIFLPVFVVAAFAMASGSLGLRSEDYRRGKKR